MVDYLLRLGQAAAVYTVYLLSLFVYRVYFDSLSSYPGPKLWAFSRLPITYHKLRGHLPYTIKELHDTYGPVIRIAPDTVSYITAEAWDEIYGFVKGSKTQNFPKYLKERLTPQAVPDIISSHGDDHRRFRKLQAHAFSDKALAAQEPILDDYIRQFVSGLKKAAKSTDSITRGVPLGTWFNFATFDLIGDLAFGEPFDCLRSGDLHPWIQSIFNIFEIGAWIAESKQYSILGKVVFFMLPRSLRNTMADNRALAADKAQRRMDSDVERPDFMSYILKNNDTEKGMTPEEIRANAVILIIAGSETTATTLTGTTYYLLKNRPILDKLTAEIRNAFASQEDMTLNKLAQQKYLNAVLEEGLRIFPVVPSTLPRIVPMGGALICGKFVPGGTIVGVNPLSANLCASNFTSPMEFSPERWMGDPRFANDNFKARQPFSVGPANCIGKNLAYAEMRLLLANLVWHFDVEIVQEQEDGDWLERARIFTLWVKAELRVKLTEREL